MTITPTIKTAAFLVISLILLVLHGALVAQTPPTNQAARTGSLKQIIPGHYVYTTNNEGRLFKRHTIKRCVGRPTANSQALRYLKNQTVQRLNSRLLDAYIAAWTGSDRGLSRRQLN